MSLSQAETGCAPTQCSARSSSAAVASRSYCSAILSVCRGSGWPGARRDTTRRLGVRTAGPPAPGRSLARNRVDDDVGRGGVSLTPGVELARHTATLWLHVMLYAGEIPMAEE